MPGLYSDLAAFTARIPSRTSVIPMKREEIKRGYRAVAQCAQFGMNDQLLQRIKQCPNLPSLPSIAMQVLDLAQKPDADIAEIARIISKDPAMSGKIPANHPVVA